MPARNSIKQYLENGFYHIYNRGVEKRKIFLDSQDHSVFLSYLKDYLNPKDELSLKSVLFSTGSTFREKARAFNLLSLKNFFGEIELVAYVLMPNHFHLLIKQTKEDGIDRFISSLGTRYSMYFNKKYHRVGKLFQGVYKAVLVDTGEQLMHLSRYIHLNSGKSKMLPSSLPEFLGERNTAWIHPDHVLEYFTRNNTNNSYRNFVESYGDIVPIANLLID